MSSTTPAPAEQAADSSVAPQSVPDTDVPADVRADEALTDASVEASADAPTDSPPETPAASAPVDVRADSAASPAATAAKLAELFPALFKGQPKPLKLRIQVDIQERAPGVFSKQVLSAFFRRYTGATSYLIAVSKASQRFDLDGQPAGELTEEHRKVAADELARRRANANAKREQEQQERRNRATLLRDFETTKLTTANFCALKGVPAEALDGLLTLARAEAVEDAEHAKQRRPEHGRGGPQQRHGQGRRQEGPRGEGGREAGGRTEGGARPAGGPRREGPAGGKQGADAGPRREGGGGGGRPPRRP